VGGGGGWDLVKYLALCLVQAGNQISRSRGRNRSHGSACNHLSLRDAVCQKQSACDGGAQHGGDRGGKQTSKQTTTMTTRGRCCVLCCVCCGNEEEEEGTCAQRALLTVVHRRFPAFSGVSSDFAAFSAHLFALLHINCITSTASHPPHLTATMSERVGFRRALSSFGSRIIDLVAFRKALSDRKASSATPLRNDDNATSTTSTTSTTTTNHNSDLVDIDDGGDHLHLHHDECSKTSDTCSSGQPESDNDTALVESQGTQCHHNHHHHHQARRVLISHTM
jgi:hypothetical protein